MNYINACNISNNFFHLNLQRNILVIFCYVAFLLDCFINLIASKNITVDFKRKAMGSLDLVSTLLMLKLPEKGKDRNLFNYFGAQQNTVCYYVKYTVCSVKPWLIINAVLVFKESPPCFRTTHMPLTIGSFPEFCFHFWLLSRDMDVHRSLPQMLFMSREFLKWLALILSLGMV